MRRKVAGDTVDASGPLRLLVVDDEPRYARSLRLLVGRDHHVEIATNGTRALALVEAGASFDVVLCDLVMPGMDGIELYEALTRSHPDLVPRIVFLTGGATTQRARAFLQRPDVRFLEKPIELATLERAIRRVTERVSRAAS
jgi:CheY-like chemotaxis protein